MVFFNVYQLNPISYITTILALFLEKRYMAPEVVNNEPYGKF